MTHLIKKYHKSVKDTQTARELLEVELQRHFDFKVGIIEQASDGTCIINEDNHTLAPLETVLPLIKNKHTKITVQQFNRLTI